MKLPSIVYLLNNAKQALQRFSLTILSAFVSVCLGIFLIENEKNIDNLFPYINIMLCASIGIPLFFCITIYATTKQLSKRNIVFMQAIATLLLACLYFTFPNANTTHNTSLPYIKYAIYNITCHLFVSFIPFVFNRQLNAFWHYNKILFLRILTSILYSAVIYIGLIVALSSLHLLFDIYIDYKLYAEIFIVTAGFFNTWFFVAGIPSNFTYLENNEVYPKGLKIFAQFVLLPLLVLYLIILYAYGTKIFISWNWPKGIVAYLIICVAVVGILTCLLLYPYGNKEENKWIKKSTKAYYFILFPLLIILFIAIFMRINDYGITISRYVILMLSVWLCLVCIYTAIGKTNIKFIPTSLALLLLMVSFGQWGMFSVSETSQVKRLQQILEQAKILKGNHVQHETIWINDNLNSLYAGNELANENKLPDSLHNEVKSILDYLDEHHGFSSIKQWYQQNLDSMIVLNIKKQKISSNYNEAELYMKTLGLSYTYKYVDDNKSKYNFNSTNNSTLKLVSGYDYFMSFSSYHYNEDKYTISNFTIDSIDYSLIYASKPTIQLTLTTKSETLSFALDSLTKSLIKEYGSNAPTIPKTKMQLFNANKKFDIKIELTTINPEEKNKSLKIVNLSGEIYITKRK